MLYADILTAEDYADDVETKGVTGALKARHPDFGRTDELSLFPPAHCRHRTAERVSRSRFHFNKGHDALLPTPLGLRGNEIYVPMAILESSLRDLPAVDGEPLLRDAFPADSHLLPGY